MYGLRTHTPDFVLSVRLTLVTYVVVLLALHPGGEDEADATAAAVGHVGSRHGADQLEVCGDPAQRVQDQGQALLVLCVCVCWGVGCVCVIAANPPGFPGNIPDFETCPGIPDLKKNPGF